MQQCQCTLISRYHKNTATWKRKDMYPKMYKDHYKSNLRARVCHKKCVLILCTLCKEPVKESIMLKLAELQGAKKVVCTSL
jgi:hypothetical protein